jgi:hypothetical protein
MPRLLELEPLPPLLELDPPPRLTELLDVGTVPWNAVLIAFPTTADV